MFCNDSKSVGTAHASRYSSKYIVKMHLKVLRQTIDTTFHNPTLLLMDFAFGCSVCVCSTWFCFLRNVGWTTAGNSRKNHGKLLHFKSVRIWFPAVFTYLLIFYCVVIHRKKEKRVCAHFVTRSKYKKKKRKVYEYFIFFFDILFQRKIPKKSDFAYQLYRFVVSYATPHCVRRMGLKRILFLLAVLLVIQRYDKSNVIASLYMTDSLRANHYPNNRRFSNE